MATHGSPEYDAFLSYSSRDIAAVTRIQRFLESYRLPGGRRLRVYRDETDMSAGELSSQLQERLRESKVMLVCCSEAVMESRWVAREIDYFRESGPDRTILLILLNGEPPGVIPAALRSGDELWADVRKGWSVFGPRRETRIGLVRTVAAAAGIPFRELLPLDRRRRRALLARAIGAAVVTALAASWWPVTVWTNVTPDRSTIAGCGCLGDEVVFYDMNLPQATKSTVTVIPAGAGRSVREGALRSDVVPRGRLLPGGVVNGACVAPPTSWVGEPQPGLCVEVRESAQTAAFADPHGGGDAPLTDVVVKGGTSTLDQFWAGGIDPDFRSNYGVRATPSAGLPVAASESGDQIWLGFPASRFLRGGLWRTSDGGGSWEKMEDVTDVSSLALIHGELTIAGRIKGALGFHVLRDGWEPMSVPGKGDQLEICGMVDGDLVVRTDRELWRRESKPWWRTKWR